MDDRSTFRHFYRGLSSLGSMVLGVSLLIACNGQTVSQSRKCNTRVANLTSLDVGIETFSPETFSKLAEETPETKGSFNVTGDEAAAKPAGTNSLGGFVTFALKPTIEYQDFTNITLTSAGAKLLKCSASFKLEKKNGQFEADVFTAAHCFRGNELLIEKISIDLYDVNGRGYFKEIPITESFLKARNDALKELASAGFDANLQKVFSSRFMPGYALLAKNYDDRIRQACSNGLTGADGNFAYLTKPGEQVLCFTPADVAFLHVELTEGNPAKNPDHAGLAEFLEAKFKEQSLALGAQQTAAARAAELVSRMNKDYATSQRDHGAFDYIDFVTLGCLPQAPDEPTRMTTGNAASSAGDEILIDLDRSLMAPSPAEIQFMKSSFKPQVCKRLSEFKRIAEKYLLLRSVKPSEYATRIAYDDPIGTGAAWWQASSYEAQNRNPQAPRAWATLLDELKKAPNDLHIHFNFKGRTSQDSRFADSVAMDFTADKRSARYLWPAPDAQGLLTQNLLLSTPLSLAKLLFQEGDSGTLISWKGLHPLMVLAAVDGEPTSAGAAAMNLPKRQVSANESAQRTSDGQSKGTNSKEKGSTTSVSTADCR